MHQRAKRCITLISRALWSRGISSVVISTDATGPKGSPSSTETVRPSQLRHARFPQVHWPHRLLTRVCRRYSPNCCGPVRRKEAVGPKPYMEFYTHG
jgi:hypothetical protein